MERLSRRAVVGPLLAPALFGIRQRRPNVLFITVDDLNTRLGCYGAPVVTPHIDRLAGRGVRFDRAYCQYPLCNPSRTSLLTGRRPPSTQVTHNHHWFRTRIPGAVTLPAHYRHNGYTTAQIGKVFHRGRDDEEAWNTGGTKGSEGEPITAEAQKQWGRTADRWAAIDGNGEDQPDARIALGAVSLLRTLARQGKPFFLAIGFARPHAPLVAPKRCFDLYHPADMELPADFAAQPPGNEWPFRPNFDLFATRQATRSLAREAIAAYYACVSFVDEQVGRVMAEFDALGLGEDTIVVFWGDNGWHLGAKGLWSKMTLFEDSLRVPFTIFAPGVSGAGGVCGRTVEMVDLYPTLIELCGLPPARDLEGRTLAPLLRDPTASWDKPAYSYLTHGARGASVRNGRFRYTEWTGGGVKAELYDYQTDPGESKNLADSPEYGARVSEMRALLAKADKSSR